MFLPLLLDWNLDLVRKFGVVVDDVDHGAVADPSLVPFGGDRVRLLLASSFFGVDAARRHLGRTEVDAAEVGFLIPELADGPLLGAEHRVVGVAEDDAIQPCDLAAFALPVDEQLLQFLGHLEFGDGPLLAGGGLRLCGCGCVAGLGRILLRRSLHPGAAWRWRLLGCGESRPGRCCRPGFQRRSA